jgi:copper chaperone CopZ
VARALETVHGVRSVEVSYPEKVAIIAAYTNVTVSELCQALTNGGFVVSPSSEPIA